jgi:hypothetical protein
MPAPVWTLNDSRLDLLGLTLVSGHFRSYGVSTMRLERACDYDATPLFTFGTPVLLARDGVPVFQGKIHSNPVRASGAVEGQSLEISDAWADLETMVYQEPWALGSGSVLLPRAVLGIGWNSVSEEWERITAGAQIREVINYAIANGVDIQLGSLPTGELMIPSEVSNVTCVEMLRACLKLHPDWIPYLDHSTTPPTFHVVPTGTATAASFPVDGSGQVEAFQVVHRTDLLPDSVRVVYELATTIDDEVYRNVVVDKFPVSGPDAGPRVIMATIPLAGMQMQIQKSRIQTRTIPTGTGAAADAYVIKRFPAMAAVDPDHFVVTQWDRTVVADPDPMPDPISAQAPKVALDDPDDPDELPRELLKGTLEDWMRRKSGTVRIDMKVVPLAGATDAERAAIKSLPCGFTVTATNATTKIYKGISQWVAPETVPTGIAQETYQAILAAMTYQGTVTLTDADVGATSYHGRNLSLTGGPAAWATMKAPIHSVDFDVVNGRVEIGFGPIPALAPADFLELQRILRFRPSKWWSFGPDGERGSNQIGAAAAPSAAGDTVGGCEGPDRDQWHCSGALEQFQVNGIYNDSGTWKCRVKQGQVLTINPEPGTVSAYLPTTPADTTEFTITAGTVLYCEVTTDKQDLATAAAIVNSLGTPAHAQPDPGGQTGLYYYKIADFQTVAGEVVLKTQFHQGGPIIHRPARNNRNLHIVLEAWVESTGVLEPDTEYTGPTGVWFRQGNYVGITDPSDGATEDTVTFSRITGVS